MSIKLSRFLVLISAFAVVGYQLFWLQGNYRSEKRQLLKESENLLKEELLKAQLLQNGVTNLPALIETLEHITAQLKILDKVLPRQVKKKAGGDLDISTSSLTSLFPIDTGQISLLTQKIHSVLAAKQSFRGSGLSFTIHAYYKNKLYAAYPARENATGYSTGMVYFPLGNETGFKLSYNNPNGILLRSLSEPIILSLIYVLLAALTLMLLLKNLSRSRRMLEMRTVFAYNMTHELKIPVATLAVPTEAMEKYGTLSDPAMAQKHIKLMRQDIDRLAGTIDNILSDARLQNGEIVLHKEHVPLITLIKETERKLSTQLLATRSTLDYTLVPHQLNVFADIELLTGVFSNLLDNAIKYADKVPHIVIQAKKIGRDIQISVTDNGKGISPAYRKLIFEPYFRIQHNDLSLVSGHGLGLSQAKHIVKLHKGKLSLKHSDETGSTFLIKIPIGHDRN